MVIPNYWLLPPWALCVSPYRSQPYSTLLTVSHFSTSPTTATQATMPSLACTPHSICSMDPSNRDAGCLDACLTLIWAIQAMAIVAEPLRRSNGSWTRSTSGGISRFLVVCAYRTMSCEQHVRLMLQRLPFSRFPFFLFSGLFLLQIHAIIYPKGHRS